MIDDVPLLSQKALQPTVNWNSSKPWKPIKNYTKIICGVATYHVPGYMHIHVFHLTLTWLLDTFLALDNRDQRSNLIFAKIHVVTKIMDVFTSRDRACRSSNIHNGTEPKVNRASRGMDPRYLLPFTVEISRPSVFC